MLTLAAVLLLSPVQDESRLKESWPKLVDAWKAVEAYSAAAPGDDGDELLKTAAKVHEAFEAGGLYAADGEYVPQALKTFIKVRARGWMRHGGLTRRTVVFWEGYSTADPMKGFLEALTRLVTLEKKGLDDEDNVQDELAGARKALKAMGVTSDETPGPLRRRVLALARALALGEPYPEPAVATEDQAKAIRDLIGRLSHESIEERDMAVRDLRRFGDAALPFIREALNSPDGETAARSRRMLGVGHAPWKTAPAALAGDDKARFLESLKIMGAKERVEVLKKELDRAREQK